MQPDHMCKRWWMQQRSHGCIFLALVSVYDTHVVWARHGFKIVKDDSLVDKLASYGETAKFMIRDLK